MKKTSKPDIEKDKEYKDKEYCDSYEKKLLESCLLTKSNDKDDQGESLDDCDFLNDLNPKRPKQNAATKTKNDLASEKYEEYEEQDASGALEIEGTEIKLSQIYQDTLDAAQIESVTISELDIRTLTDIQEYLSNHKQSYIEVIDESLIIIEDRYLNILNIKHLLMYHSDKGKIFITDLTEGAIDEAIQSKVNFHQKLQETKQYAYKAQLYMEEYHQSRKSTPIFLNKKQDLLSTENLSQNQIKDSNPYHLDKNSSKRYITMSDDLDFSNIFIKEIENQRLHPIAGEAMIMILGRACCVIENIENESEKNYIYFTRVEEYGIFIKISLQHHEILQGKITNEFIDPSKIIIKIRHKDNNDQIPPHELSLYELATDNNCNSVIECIAKAKSTSEIIKLQAKDAYSRELMALFCEQPHDPSEYNPKERFARDEDNDHFMQDDDNSHFMREDKSPF